MSERCEECGGRFDRPGLYGCTDGHVTPTPAQRIVQIVEHECNSRRGLHWSSVDEGDILDELRDTLADKIARALDGGSDE